MALAFQKLNLAAIYEQGEWPHNLSQCVVGLIEGRDLLVVEFSPNNWLKCLGCHMVMEKGTHIDVNLSYVEMVYSAVFVVMMRIAHKQVYLSTKIKQKLE